MKKRIVKRLYGYIPDCGDIRDIPFMGLTAPVDLPSSVDLRPLFLPVYDQGRTGSCVAQATAAAHWFCNKQQAQEAFDPSRLFIYYEARHLERREKYDAGCMIRDAIKVLAKNGVCPEADWPFLIKNVCVHPPHSVYPDALNEQALEYYRLSNGLMAMRQCLADGFPFVTGISLYASFQSAAVAKSGVVSMPIKGERFVGGHAVLVVGYNDPMEVFIVRNSWGSWGQAGYFTIPYDYLCNQHLCTDSWTLRKVE